MNDEEHPTVEFVDYSKKITINNQRTVLDACPVCGCQTPHVELANGNVICGLCGTEHA
jgi:uncharacterized membrane protein